MREEVYNLLDIDDDYDDVNHMILWLIHVSWTACKMSTSNIKENAH